MRITVDLDDKTLKDLQRITGLSKKSPAVQAALAAYLREERKKKVIHMVMEGKTDYGMTNEELEARSLYDPR